MTRTRKLGAALALAAAAALSGLAPAHAAPERPTLAGASVGAQVRVSTDGDGRTVVTVEVPADGERHAVEGVTVQAAPVDPRTAATAVSCHFVLNTPVNGFIQQWPSIINSGGVDCRIAPSAGPGDGVLAAMVGVSMTTQLQQLELGVWRNKASGVLFFGPGFVSTWYARAMATCVAAFNYEDMRQWMSAAFVPASGAVGYGSGASPQIRIYGCQQL